MKKLLLSSIAVLLLATGAARAVDKKWEGDFRKCEIVKIFPKAAPNPDDDGILRGEIDDYGISIWGDSVGLLFDLMI
jgi:hypothetical protein